MADRSRRAIIDIGSNSIRLVVYHGAPRAPMQVFNEKLMAGLGAELATTGRIDARAFERGIAALSRFKRLSDAMALDSLRCVATAAVRDAENGPDFMASACALGLNVELLSGAQEAAMAGYGIISGAPHADGIGADLGGGSLELVRVRGGKVERGHSFPLGVLRLPQLIEQSGRGFKRSIRKLLRDANWPGEEAQLPLYLVGGSWRAIARFHMAHFPVRLPVIAGHAIPLEDVDGLARRIGRQDLATLSALPGLASARVASMADASRLLGALTAALDSSRIELSASGLREGLMYSALSEEARAQDPLLVAAAAEGRRFARFAPHGPAIDRWIEPLFDEDKPADARLRLAACLLTDVASSANPDFRTERAVEMSLHGQWMGVTPEDRLVLAQTLYAATGGRGQMWQDAADKLLTARLRRATWWGLAIRLAQRLSGGTAEALALSRLAEGKHGVELTLAPSGAALMGEQVEKRLRQLANAVGRSYRVIIEAG